MNRSDYEFLCHLYHARREAGSPELAKSVDELFTEACAKLGLEPYTVRHLLSVALDDLQGARIV